MKISWRRMQIASGTNFFSFFITGRESVEQRIPPGSLYRKRLVRYNLVIRNEGKGGASHAYGRCVAHAGGRRCDVCRFCGRCGGLDRGAAQGRKAGSDLGGQEAADHGRHVGARVRGADDQLHHPRHRLVRPSVRRIAAHVGAWAVGGILVHDRDPHDPVSVLCRRRPDGAGRERLEHGVLRLLCRIFSHLSAADAQPLLCTPRRAGGEPPQDHARVRARLCADAAARRVLGRAGDDALRYHGSAVRRVLRHHAAHSFGYRPDRGPHHGCGAAVPL